MPTGGELLEGRAVSFLSTGHIPRGDDLLIAQDACWSCEYTFVSSEGRIRETLLPLSWALIDFPFELYKLYCKLTVMSHILERDEIGKCRASRNGVGGCKSALQAKSPSSLNLPGWSQTRGSGRDSSPGGQVIYWLGSFRGDLVVKRRPARCRLMPGPGGSGRPQSRAGRERGGHRGQPPIRSPGAMGVRPSRC